MKAERGRIITTFESYDHTFDISLTFTIDSKATDTKGKWYSIFVVTSDPNLSKGKFGTRYPGLWYYEGELGVFFDLSPHEQAEWIPQSIKLDDKAIQARIKHFEVANGNWILEFCIDGDSCVSREYSHPQKKDITMPKMHLYLSNQWAYPMQGIIHNLGINIMSNNFYYI